MIEAKEGHISRIGFLFLLEVHLVFLLLKPSPRHVPCALSSLSSSI